MTNDQDNSNNPATAETPAPAESSRLRQTKIVLSFLALVLGIATIIVTLTNGGGPTSRGILFGGILALMAGMRLFLTVGHHV